MALSHFSHLKDAPVRPRRLRRIRAANDRWPLRLSLAAIALASLALWTGIFALLWLTL